MEPPLQSLVLMKRKNVRTLFLIVGVFTYLLIGAAVFDYLESQQEARSRQNLHDKKKNWQKKYNMTDQEFQELTEFILRMKSYKFGKQWKFAGAFYFVTTVITTIGYGHSTPKTPPGKLFCMAYAISGIPLNMIMFHSIGERLNNFIIYLLKQAKRLLRFSNREISTTTLMIVIANMIGILLIGGAAAFAHYENWGYLDAFYYCFITLTAIGFGDFVALQRDNRLSNSPDYVAFSLLFIFFGHSIVCCGMNLFVLRCMTKKTDQADQSDRTPAVDNSTPTGALESSLSGSFADQNHPIATISAATALKLTEKNVIAASGHVLPGEDNWEAAFRPTAARKTMPAGRWRRALATTFASLGRNQASAKTATYLRRRAVQGLFEADEAPREPVNMCGIYNCASRRSEYWRAPKARYTVARRPVFISHLLTNGQTNAAAAEAAKAGDGHAVCIDRSFASPCAKRASI